MTSLFTFSFFLFRCNPFFVRCIKPNNMKVEYQAFHVLNCLFRGMYTEVYSLFISAVAHLCLDTRCVRGRPGQQPAATLWSLRDNQDKERGISSPNAILQLPLQVKYTHNVDWNTNKSLSFRTVRKTFLPSLWTLRPFTSSEQNWGLDQSSILGLFSVNPFLISLATLFWWLS